MNYLESLLASEEHTGPRFVVTESLFSMDGDFSPIDDLLDLIHRYDCWLILDEAHSTGVFGQGGRGCLEGKTLSDKVISVHTCGKALGAYGAFVLLPTKVKELLVNRCAHFIYTTALPPLNVIHIRWALEFIESHPERRQTLQRNLKLQQELCRKNLEIEPSQSQIQPLVVGDSKEVVSVSGRVGRSGL